jgi:putative oxidoreductase
MMKPDLENKWMKYELGGNADSPSPEAGTNRVRKPGMSAPGDLALLFTRLVFGFSIFCHGAQKLFGLFGGQQMLHDPWMLAAGVLEFAGGIAIALGLFTRQVAFVLCGEMAVVYFKVHFPGGLWPIENHGELEVLYCFFFLYLSMRGAGMISVDGIRGKA